MNSIIESLYKKVETLVYSEYVAVNPNEAILGFVLFF